LGNAILQAKTPNFDRLWRRFPHAVLAAAGESVGLPPGQMGTSEVNHMTIGAGRVIFQDLVRINEAIKDKSFFRNQAMGAAFEHVKKHGSTLHLRQMYPSGKGMSSTFRDLPASSRRLKPNLPACLRRQAQAGL
jgi:2,3-bisphosphoglycerate-independent phosphoglycerate mutase